MPGMDFKNGIYIWISKHVRSFLGTFLKSLSEMNIDGIYGFLNMSGVDFKQTKILIFLALLHFFKKLLRNEYKWYIWISKHVRS